MDLFNNFINGNPITESVDEEKSDVFTEAYYPDKIPYNKVMLNKTMTLPRGTKTGRGNICFLYSHSFEESNKLMTNSINFINGKHYYFYYLPQRYRGKIYNKNYNVNYTKKAHEIYSKFDKEGVYIKGYKRPILNAKDNRNMYFDMNVYLNIFEKICNELPPKKKISLYWTYILSILKSTDSVMGTGMFESRFILVDCTRYALSKGLKENMNNPLFAIYYTLFKYPDCLKDINVDFYFFAEKKTLKINPSTLAQTDYKLLKVQMTKLYNGIVSQSIQAEVLDEEMINKNETISSVSVNVLNKKEDTTKGLYSVIKVENDIAEVTNKDIEKTTPDKGKEIINKKIEIKAEEVQKKVDEKLAEQNIELTQEEKEKIVEKRVEAEINSDRALIDQLYQQLNKEKPKKSTASTARDAMLRTQQEELKIKNMTISDLREIKSKDLTIPEISVANKVTTTNEGMKTIKFENMDKAYEEKLLPKDITNAFLSLNTKSTPMYIRKIDVQETSDNLNYKDTYTVYYEDDKRQRHTITVDIPKLIDGRYIYIGGNKKIIKYQTFLNPIVKCGESEVQIVTNYNKMFVRRVDTGSISSIQRMKKLLKTNDDIKKYFKFGNAYPANSSFITTIEYDELSKIIISYKNKGTVILFDQSFAMNYAEANNIKIMPNYMFCGMEGERPIFVNIDTQKTQDDRFIIDIIIESLGEDVRTEFQSIKASKRLMYTTVTLMAKAISTSMLIGFWEGLTTVMKKAKIEYQLYDKSPRQLKSSQNFIRFADCFMVYDENVSTALLMNGFRLSEIRTEEYNISDFDTPNPYIDYFKKKYGKANITSALVNFYEWMIDPITLDMLKQLNLPQDIVGLLIYAINLLSDSQFTSELKASVQRLRRAEIIPALLYENLANNYILYKNGAGRKKYSMNKDAVINGLLKITTVEDTSTLNPTLEMDIAATVSAKGLHGSNLDESYTLAKRNYDPSMVGIITPCASPAADTGVSKTLTIEPNITNLRGNLVPATSKDLKDMKDVNLFSLSDLTIPLGATVDDPTRLGHAIKQSKHVIPVKNSAPVLISSGLEEVARFHLSDEFVINADEDGEVVVFDEDKKLMIVKYKSGKCRAINLGPQMVKNGGGGFYLSNELATNLKLGDKVHKNDALAWHKDFFTNDRYNNCRMNMGTLTKVAIMSSYDTYEDATFITEKLSEDASTEMSFCKSIVIGKNSNMYFLVKEGDTVEVGDPLAIFDTSFEDSDLNSFLDNLSDSEKAAVENSSRNIIQSKWTGTVKKIMMYSAVDLSEMSPSLAKIVKAYYKKIDDKNKLLEEYEPESKNSIMKCGLLIKDTTKKITPKYGMIKGDNVMDSVKIEVYIEHSEPLEIGSKIAQFTGLKNTICEIVEKGYEPYSSFRPDEEVGTIIASNSILKRMTPSIILSVLGNKVVIETKRALKEIWDE